MDKKGFKMFQWVVVLAFLSTLSAEDQSQVGGLIETEKQKNGQTVCYEKYGCYSTEDFKGIIPNFMTVLPETPENVNVTFYVYNKDRMQDPLVIHYTDPIEKLEEINFDPTKQITFVIHGYLNAYLEKADHGKIKNFLLLKNPESYVFAVDWSGGASDSNYARAVATLPLVANIIAGKIKSMGRTLGLSPRRVTIVGHSLGAHMSGLIGKKFVDLKIGRIMGLDPAGPLFNHEFKEKRLTSSDAEYVEIIHTDTLSKVSFGLPISCGDVDFFPNGGEFQPGCGLNPIRNFKRILSAVFDSASCSHGRSMRHFYTNFQRNTLCESIAYACDNWEDFQKGLCSDCGPNNENCLRYGFSLEVPEEKKQGRSYYLKTSERAPWCTHQYAIFIQLGSLRHPIRGSIKISVNGKSAKVKGITFVDQFKSEQMVSKVFTHRKAMNVIQSLKLTWTQYTSPMQRKKIGSFRLAIKPVKLPIKSIKIQAMSFWDPEQREKFSATLCSSDTTAEHGKTLLFTLC